MGRYRLAGREHVKQIAPCPGGHFSAGSALGWDLIGPKWVQFSQCTGEGGGQKDVLSDQKKNMGVILGEFLTLLFFL